MKRGRLDAGTVQCLLVVLVCAGMSLGLIGWFEACAAMALGDKSSDRMWFGILSFVVFDCGVLVMLTSGVND